MGLILTKGEEQVKSGVKTDILKTRTCERCKSQVPLAKVRLYAQNETKNLLLCEGCCDILKKKGSGLPDGQKVIKNVYQPRDVITNQPSTVGRPEVKVESKVVNRPQMSCVRCDYKFTINESQSGAGSQLSCPYCGKSDRLQRVRI